MTNIDYLLVTGVFVVGFLALSLMMLDALVNATAIKSIVLSLPVG
jgi:hypothetical protein